VLEPGFRIGDEQPDVLLPVGIPAQVARKYPSPHIRILARLATVLPARRDATADPIEVIRN
jgi:hypothetical protein